MYVRNRAGVYLVPYRLFTGKILGTYTALRNLNNNFRLAILGEVLGCYNGTTGMGGATEFKPQRFFEGGAGEWVDIIGTREIKMMPFGVGRWICTGLGLAMLHLEYYVASLVREFEWKSVEEDEVDLAEKLEFTVVIKNPLRARVIPGRDTSS